jgi:predicted MFS family arabinose efflux permease
MNLPTQAVPASLSGDIRWRLAIPTILFMFLASLDRVNISFAATQMTAELGMSPSQYGLASGLVYLGFLAGQFPSVLLLQRIGFHRWLSLIAILWGLGALGMAFVRSPHELYALRVWVGFAEGGLAPGIVLYLSQFASDRQRASTFAIPMLAIPLSITLGGPISGWLLDMNAPGALASWRWMFLAEGIPTVLVGVAAYFYFPDSPAETKWLKDSDRAWLAANSAGTTVRKQINDWSVVISPMVLISSLLWFCLLAGAYGIMFWLPQVVEHMTGLSAFQTGLVNALPWIGVGLGIYFNSAHSDRTGERFWHIGLPGAIAGLAIIAANFAGAGALGLALLFLVGLTLGAAQGTFWALPMILFGPATAALGVVTINIAGTSAGIVVPHIIGFVREATGGFTAAAFLVGGFLLFSALVVLIIRLYFLPNYQGDSR